ncbi:hypothetical protein DV515_00004131, partial [Chloebia gouldiae]
DVPRQNQDSSYKALFLKYAKQGSTIDASQLQQLLNEDIFFKEDRNHSGFLDVAELKNAIQAAGLATDAQLLRLMTLRYGDASGRVGFSDFVCCMLRLDTMTHAFQNLAEGGSQIWMTAMEWLTLVMYT